MLRPNLNKPFKTGEQKQRDFEKMMEKFLKNSRKKSYEISDEHTKSGKKKAKAENAKRRKIASKKRED